VVPTLLSSWKVQAIDAAFGRAGVRSFVDLGGVWKVNGGYTFHALDHYEVERAALVDIEFNEETRERAERHPQLALVQGRFHDEKVLQHVRGIDAALFFDVLVHQASPHWDEVLAAYATAVGCMVIANPQWTGGECVRLPDLEPQEFIANVPHDQHHSHHLTVHQDPDSPDRFAKRRRDSHTVWQWGITDDALRDHMRDLGYELAYYDNFGRFGEPPRFENHAFVFVRR
jgi:hypothetical protein